MRVGRLKELDDDPAFNVSYKALSMAAAILGIVVICAGAGVSLYRHFGSATRVVPPATVERSQHPSVGSAFTGSPYGTAPHIGDCLDAEVKVVACDSTHVYEVFSYGPTCQEGTVLDYLGGVPGVDVLSTQIRITARSSDPPLCFLQPPPGASPTGTAHLILDTVAGDGWRRCSDDRFGGRAVSCADAHTTEFVYLGILKPHEALNCPGRAATYLDAEISALLDQVEIASTTMGPQSVCVVKARGENHFTGSLRRLGTEALPIAPD